MQTIIGSTGAIGIELAKSLKAYTSTIRLVSRNPKKVNDSDELFPADILNYTELESAIKNSTVVYVTVGFEYNSDVWEEIWPKFIDNLIKICKNENCKLVFFDNIYMYNENHINGMTEETVVNPISRKGKVRMEIANKIMTEVANGSLKAIIARSADFYGPSIKNNSLLTETVFNPLSKGEKANWFESIDFKHSFTYTVDAGKATAMLGNTETAYGQIWHLPTASNTLTLKQWIEKIAINFNVVPQSQLLPKQLVAEYGTSNIFMREAVEMMYQYDRDYVCDSSKFEKEFSFEPTSYEKGIDTIINIDYK